MIGPALHLSNSFKQLCCLPPTQAYNQIFTVADAACATLRNVKQRCAHLSPA